ncbi:deSI-like protein [Populus alba x Populus x berolinensis]|nr:deSI-like protein [Populus alba x Populus x berolinensis]
MTLLSFLTGLARKDSSFCADSSFHFCQFQDKNKKGTNFSYGIPLSTDAMVLEWITSKVSSFHLFLNMEWLMSVSAHLQIRNRGNAVTGFCIFPKAKSSGYSPGNTPVYLNVYDLTDINGYAYWAGFGIYHSGVEVYGVEYAFGAHDYPSSGVFEVEPRQCPGFKFRKSVFMGTTILDPKQVREFMELQSGNYNGDTYHLIAKNCNHFCEDTCYKLTGNRIPKWVNRLARIGIG